MPKVQDQERIILGQQAPSGDAAIQTTAPVGPIAPPSVPDWAAPSLGMLVREASFLTVKSTLAGGAIGAVVSRGARREGAVKGAVVSAALTPIVLGAAEIGRIYLSDGDPPEVRQQRIATVMKVSGISTGIGLALWGLHMVLTKKG